VLGDARFDPVGALGFARGRAWGVVPPLTGGIGFWSLELATGALAPIVSLVTVDEFFDLFDSAHVRPCTILPSPKCGDVGAVAAHCRAAEPA
jgi:hypothetical protein